MIARGGFSRSSRTRNSRSAAARAFDLDEDALRGIRDPAVQVQFLRQPVNERPKADALHGSADDGPGAFVVCSHGWTGFGLRVMTGIAGARQGDFDAAVLYEQRKWIEVETGVVGTYPGAAGRRTDGRGCKSIRPPFISPR